MIERLTRGWYSVRIFYCVPTIVSLLTFWAFVFRDRSFGSFPFIAGYGNILPFNKDHAI